MHTHTHVDIHTHTHTLTRAVTIYQYVAILQYDIEQYIYCSILRVLCEPELDHRNVNLTNFFSL